MMRVSNHSINLKVFLLVDYFHVPDPHLRQATSPATWCTPASTPAGSTVNRTDSSRHKREENETTSKSKAKLCLSYIRGGHCLSLTQEEACLQTMLLLFFSTGEDKEVSRCQRKGSSKAAKGLTQLRRHS